MAARGLNQTALPGVRWWPRRRCESPLEPLPRRHRGVELDRLWRRQPAAGHLHRAVGGVECLRDASRPLYRRDVGGGAVPSNERRLNKEAIRQGRAPMFREFAGGYPLRHQQQPTVI